MKICSAGTFLDLNLGGGRIDVHNHTEEAAVNQGRLDLVVPLDTHFLTGIGVTVNDTPLDGLDPLHELEPGDRSTRVEHLLVSQVPQPEILPPHRLVLAPVPLQHLCQ